MVGLKKIDIKALLHREIVFSLVIIVLGVYILNEAWGLPIPQRDAVGPAFFPKIVGYLFLTMGLLNMAFFLISINKGIVMDKLAPVNVVKLIGMIFLMALYIYMFRVIGYWYSSFLYLTLLLVVVSPERMLRRVIKSSLISFISVSVIYVIFVNLLRVPLP